MNYYYTVNLFVNIAYVLLFFVIRLPIQFCRNNGDRNTILKGNDDNRWGNAHMPIFWITLINSDKSKLSLVRMFLSCSNLPLNRNWPVFYHHVAYVFQSTANGKLSTWKDHRQFLFSDVFCDNRIGTWLLLVIKCHQLLSRDL